MEMTPVKSSNIQSVGYDAAKRELRVQFSTGVYSYKDVPPETHAEMMKAESVGRYFHSTIRGAHEFRKLEKDDEAG